MNIYSLKSTVPTTDIQFAIVIAENENQARHTYPYKHYEAYVGDGRFIEVLDTQAIEDRWHNIATNPDEQQALNDCNTIADEWCRPSKIEVSLLHTFSPDDENEPQVIFCSFK